MINTSNEFNEVMLSSRVFKLKAKITLLDGTVLNITEDTRGNGGIRSFKIDDGVSDESTFTIGGAVINELTMVINNYNSTYDYYDFYGAVIEPYVGLQLSSSIEWLKKGIWTVDETTTAASLITLKALDNMHKFDTLLSDVNVSFPCTLQVLVTSICNYCNVTLASTTFDNDDYVIQKKPSDTTLTCRETISYVGQITGNFERCNTYGELELKWFPFTAFESEDDLDGGNLIDYNSGDDADGGNFTDYSSGDNYDGGTFNNLKNWHHFYNYTGLSIGTDDIVITGITVTDYDDGDETTAETSYTYGSEGYVLVIENNPLVERGKAQEIATFVGSKLIGMTFRQFSASTKSDPRIEAGDIGYISDRKGNSYKTALTKVSFGFNNSTAIACNAESPTSKSAVQYNASTKAIIKARESVKAEKTAREQAIEEMNGKLSESSGLYHTEETLADGSVIYYLHDKKTLAESMIIWKMNAQVLAVSTDGGKTYKYGLSADGTAILNRIYAVGISADHITTGTLEGVTIIMDNGKIGYFDIDGGNLLAKTTQEGRLYSARYQSTGIDTYGDTEDLPGVFRAGNRKNYLLCDEDEGTEITGKNISLGSFDSNAPDSISANSKGNIFISAGQDIYSISKMIQFSSPNLFQVDCTPSGATSLTMIKIENERIDLFAKNGVYINGTRIG